MALTTLLGRSVQDGSAISVDIDGDLIVRVYPAQSSIEDDLPYISPGFFDMQINGCLGVGYRFPDFIEEISSRGMITIYGLSSPRTSSMCTENPARILNMGTGKLASGMPAHLTLFYYADGDMQLKIHSVWRNGKAVFSGA